MMKIAIFLVLSGLAVATKIDISPPVFATEEHLTVRESAAHTIMLNCKANGKPKPTVEWYKNSVRISELHRRFSNYTVNRWSLWMKNGSPEDDGNYTCVAENPAGRIERQFDVKVVSRIVAHRPIIPADQPGNHTVLVGSSLALRCAPDVFDVSSPPVITWMKLVEVNGSLKDENGTLSAVTLQSCGMHGGCNLLDPSSSYIVEDGTVLNLDNVTFEHSGWYSCKAENDQGRSASIGYVEVVSEIPIDSNLADAQMKSKWLVVGTVSIIPFLLLLIGCSIFCWCRWKREEKQKLYAAGAFKSVYHWTKVVLVERQQQSALASSSEEPLLDPRVTIHRRRQLSSMDDNVFPESDYELPPDPAWEIPRGELVLSDTLGEGAFGKVLLGHMRQPPRRLQQSEARGGGDCLVAVKALKDGHSEDDLIDLVKEMEILKVIGSHPNIVNLLGVSTLPRGKPLLLIMEFAERGNLKDFLTSHRPRLFSPTPSPPTSTLSFGGAEEGAYEIPRMAASGDVTVDLRLMLKMAVEVALGMEFLSSRKCVHRDLAARNVLVTRDLVFKVADFGMARDVKSSEYYRKSTGGRLPLKWMSPESVFEQRSTTKSDAWSFAILLWEVFTYGESPHKGVPIEQFLERLREGRVILPQPSSCPNDIYSAMCQCWALRPEWRPTWLGLLNTLKKSYAETQPTDYLVMLSPRIPQY